MFTSNISAIRKRLSERKREIEVSTASAMQAGEYQEEMVKIAETVIAAQTPSGHEYLVPVLSRLVEVAGEPGKRMEFAIRYPPSDGLITQHPMATWGDKPEQLESIKSIKMDAIKYWVRHFKDWSDRENDMEGSTDEKVDTIASNVWHAIHGKDGTPEAFLNPGSHKGHDPKTSLLAVSGHYGASLTDPAVVSGVLASVLEAWKSHMAVRVPGRIINSLTPSQDPF